jgi:hypothetical protein
VAKTLARQAASSTGALYTGITMEIGAVWPVTAF